MKRTINIVATAILILVLVSCNKKNRPNYQYFPNMYAPIGYEAYGEYNNGIFENGLEAQLPAEGSIPRGWMPYDYSNSNTGYQSAKDSLKNPLAYTKDNQAAGQQLYTIYCAICHGDKGNGKGYLVAQEKILGVPSYDDQGRAITEGSIYHVMYYGINSMGSYASQTDEKERWQIVQYVQKLKADLEGKTPRSDEAAANKVASVEETGVDVHSVEGVQEHDSEISAAVDNEKAKVSGKHKESEAVSKPPVSKNFIRDNKERDEKEK